MINTSKSLFLGPFLPSPLSCSLPLFTGQETLRASQQHHVPYSISLPDTFSPFPSVILLQLRFFFLPYVATGRKSGCLSPSCSPFAPSLSSPFHLFTHFFLYLSCVPFLIFSFHPFFFPAYPTFSSSLFHV